MDAQKNQSNRKAGCCGRISKSFHWETFKLMRYMSRNKPQDVDVPSISESDMSETLGIELERRWERELDKAKCKSGYTPSLLKALVGMFGLRYALSGSFIFLGIAMRLAQPILLINLTQYYTPGYSISLLEANINALLLVLSVLFRILFQTIYGDMTRSMGMRIRAACSHLIFKKMLEKRAGACSKLHPLTLLSNDAHKFDLALEELHWLWACPLHLVLSCIMLYLVVGLPALVSAVAVFLIFCSLQLHLGKVLMRQRKSVSELTDKRLHLLSDVISGIKVIKLYAWEDHFIRFVKEARKLEFSKIKRTAAIRGFLSSFISFFDRVPIFFVLLGYTLFNQSILPYQIIAVYSLFNQTKYGLTSHFPTAITMGAEFKASITRIRAFLVENCTTVKGTSRTSEEGLGNIFIEDASAEWEANRSVLNQININLPAGYLGIVIGQVGAGKSSLLHVLLGELPLSSGSAALGGSVSYASQEPWIFYGTVRDNILFGETFNKPRYEQVVRVCALNTDLERMPNGDLSVVGDRGQTLSGGQRARISLARAVYKDADIYLLDDPLSSVDAHVSRHIFEECITTFLKNKTRLLVTHQLHTLSHCDHIVLIDEGTVKTQGSFQEMQNSGGLFQTLLFNNKSEEQESEQPISEQKEKTKTSSLQLERQLIDGESNESVMPYSLAIWKYLTKGGGVIGVFIMAVFMILSQMTINAINVFVSHWSNLETSGDLSTSARFEYLSIVGGILLFSICTTFLRTACVFQNLLSSSHFLHNSMLESVLRTHLQFFHSTPSGTILGHFTSSIGILDEQLPVTIIWFSQMTLLVLFNYIIMIAFSYECVASFIIMIILISWITRINIISIRRIKNIEGSRRTKTSDYVSDSLNGLITIRALGKMKHAQRLFDFYQDTYNSSKLTHTKMAITQNFYLSLITALVIIINVCIFTNLPGGASGPAFVGLGLYYAVSLEYALPVLVLHFSHLLAHLPSIPHIINFASLPHETEVENAEEESLQQNCSAEPAIIFSNSNFYYTSNKEPALKGISFEVDKGEKIGVVGRTGAGKSSLIAALLRLVPNQKEGSVFLHLENIRSIPLPRLRKSITVIPQEPVFFIGTLRNNLDPTGSIDDARLWEALKSVDLDSQMGSLDIEVKERGKNWSLGQRQLLSLARASLRGSQVLVFDEATASLDHNTDAAIQAAIRNLFKDCTVLTIAHRLNTIIDYDRVIVMDAGQIKECDHPYKLILDNESSFFSLVKETGKESVDYLIHLARQAYLNKQLD